MPDHKSSSLLTQLRAATEGLQFPSEADYPVEPCLLEDAGEEPLTPQRLLQITRQHPDTPVRTVDPARFFEPVTRAQDWHNADERARAQRFQHLVQTLEELLEGLQVYKLGKVESEVYVLGKAASGGFAGVKTKVVET